LGAYWDYYLLQHVVKLRKSSLAIAEKMLSEDRQRVASGQLAESEMLRMTSWVAERRRSLFQGQQELNNASEQLRNFLSLSSGSSVTLEVLAKPQEKLNLPNEQILLDHAMSARPEALIARRQVEQESARTNYYENQTLPQLDLKLSTDMTGLATHSDKALTQVNDQVYRGHAVGLEFKTPLDGKGAAAELSASRMKHQSALLEIKGVENSLVNAIATQLANLQSLTEQLAEMQAVASSNKKMQSIEQQRYAAGKSTARAVLEKEELTNQAIHAELDTQVSLEKALVLLHTTEGSILKHYGLE
ncbi:MAG: TolC family protein, partial [Magnetococcales bacterium]|nr:TolC family protein [Magnetococcales bacterium]NGZ29335.1 TolC family protein [Magnetococcales bacterium]